MRKPLYAATAVVAAMLGGGLAAAPAQASTGKEMKVCWTAPAGTNYGIKVVLDGPSSRSKWLANGECKAWSVKPGEYKVVWANLIDLFRQSQSSGQPFGTSLCGPPPQEFDYALVNPTAYVKRFKNDYVTYAYDSGAYGVRTNVKKNRMTKVNFRMNCEFYNVNN